MELKSNEEKITRALLVSVDTGEYDAQASLDELFELVKSAGADPVLSVTQNLQKIEKGTFVGTGKLAEIAEICESQEIDLLVFDSELSPTQIKNIEAETDVRVIDRTTLILDIFAQRARSKEGKLQVELAQLKYMLPRLTGKGIAMSRLGGGIGTRGPGETKLETDRRHIRRRIESLKEATAYELVAKGHFDVVDVLGKRRVTKESFERWYASQTDYRTVEDQELDADIMASTYGLPEMARMLGVHRQTIYYIVANEDFELIKVGRYKRATKESFEKWYQNQTRYQLAEDRQERS